MTWLLKACMVLPVFRMSHSTLASHAELLQLASSRASGRALAGFQRYAEELVDEYLRTGETPTDEGSLKYAVEIIEAFIKKEHENNLILHNQDKEGQNDCTEKVEACTEEWFSETHLEHIANLTIIIGKERTNHSECRETQQACCVAMSAACEKYHNTRIYDYDLFPECHDPDLSDDYIKTTVTETRETMEQCLTKVYNWHAPLYALYKACNDERVCCEDPGDECKNHQIDFEIVHCVGYDYINDHCHGHRACWDTQIGGCDTSYCPALQDRVEIRKAENETGERIICLLNVLVDVKDSEKRKELEKCKDKEYLEEQKFWNISCPANGFPPVFPPEVSKLCKTRTITLPSGDMIIHDDVETPCLTGFENTEYLPHINSGEWPLVKCIKDCPAHYTDHVNARNTSFTIPHIGELPGGH